MFVLRKLPLLVLAGIAAVVLTASPAFADPAEMWDESGTDPVHCGSVTLDGDDVSGGCEAHVVGEGVESRAHLFGFEVHVAECDNEFDINVDEGGHGYISNYSSTGDSPCDSFAPTDGAPWEFQIEDNGGGSYTMTADVSLDTPTTTCAGAFDIDLTDGDSSVTATAVDERIGTSICEVSGGWELEAPGEQVGGFPFFTLTGGVTRNMAVLDFQNTVNTMLTVTFKNETNWVVMVTETHITGGLVPGRFSITANTCANAILAKNQTCTVEITRVAGNGATSSDLRIHYRRYWGGIVGEVGSAFRSDPVELKN